MSKVLHISNMEVSNGAKIRNQVPQLLEYYAQCYAVFILTVRQRKKRKSDTKNSGQLTKFNCQKVL